VAADPAAGWKISRFIENVDFDYNNPYDEARAIDAIRHFHTLGVTVGWDMDMLTRATDMQRLVSRDYFNAYDEFAALRENVRQLAGLMAADGVPKEFCHNDCCDTNILLGKTGTWLIDWEYAGDNDPAMDICSYIFGWERTDEDVERILTAYEGHPLTEAERRHYYACIAIGGYFIFPGPFTRKAPARTWASSPSCGTASP